MSCYFRHLSEIFSFAGINVNQQNKKQLDEIIHKLIGTHYKDCPSIWREFKRQVLTSEETRRQFAEHLKSEFEVQKGI
jgi:hypothetical protein